MKHKYEDRHELYKGKVIISYPFAWCGQLRDRWMWLAELDREVLDYHLKDALINDAIKTGKDFVVLRVHRDGTISELVKGTVE